MAAQYVELLEGPPTELPNKIARSRSSYIPTLDGWRAIAIGSVIGAHSYGMLMNSGTHVGAVAARFLSHAGYGVDVFFALSGYLICTLLLEEKKRTGTISLGWFYTRRAFRILPPILVYLAALFVLGRLDKIPAIPAIDFARILLFARNYFAGPWYTGHFWSLAVEEHFYLFAPLFFLILPKRRALPISLTLVGVCVGIRWFEFAHRGWFPGELLQFRTENRFDAMLWGAILAILLQQPAVRTRMTDWLNEVQAAIIGITAVVLLNVFSAQDARRTVVAFVMPLMIAYTVLHADRLVGRFLELRFLRWIGRLSYSLYVWQMLFLPEGPRPLGQLQSFPLAFVLTLACAAASYYLVEKPMIRVGHRLAGSPK